MNAIHGTIEQLPAHERVKALRLERGETLEVFGSLIGGASKGVMSELERGLRPFTPDQALTIEGLSEGYAAGPINAAELNDIVARAREGLSGGGSALHGIGNSTEGAQDRG